MLFRSDTRPIKKDLSRLNKDDATIFLATLFRVEFFYLQLVANLVLFGILVRY